MAEKPPKLDSKIYLFLTQVGSAIFGLGLGLKIFTQKSQIFPFFTLSVEKKSLLIGSKSTRVKDGSALMNVSYHRENKLLDLWAGLKCPYWIQLLCLFHLRFLYELRGSL